MKRKSSSASRDELRPEYDAALIRSGVRGKCAARYRRGSKVVVIAPDVAGAFPDAIAVNEALRMLVGVAKRSLVTGRS
jgi:hypothetical protein